MRKRWRPGTASPWRLRLPSSRRARVDTLAHILRDALRLLAPLVFGELPVWANREADRLASDAPLSHEHLLARSGGAQPVPLQCVILMNLVAHRRCLRLIDVGLCQLRHVVSHQKRVFLAHVQQCGARYDKIRQTRNYDKTLIHKGHTD